VIRHHHHPARTHNPDEFLGLLASLNYFLQQIKRTYVFVAARGAGALVVILHSAYIINQHMLMHFLYFLAVRFNLHA